MYKCQQRESYLCNARLEEYPKTRECEIFGNHSHDPPNGKRRTTVATSEVSVSKCTKTVDIKSSTTLITCYVIHLRTDIIKRLKAPIDCPSCGLPFENATARAAHISQCSGPKTKTRFKVCIPLWTSAKSIVFRAKKCSRNPLLAAFTSAYKQAVTSSRNTWDDFPLTFARRLRPSAAKLFFVEYRVQTTLRRLASTTIDGICRSRSCSEWRTTYARIVVCAALVRTTAF